MKLTLTQAFNKFFGKKDGQSMSDFSNEIKAASATDELKKQWVAMFATVGIEIIVNPV